LETFYQKVFIEYFRTNLTAIIDIFVPFIYFQLVNQETNPVIGLFFLRYEIIDFHELNNLVIMYKMSLKSVRLYIFRPFIVTQAPW